MKEILEEWRDIAGYEGKYQVSNLGRVKSLNYQRTGEDKVLKPFPNNRGYFSVGLSKNGKVKNYLIHRLVALAFLSNPDNLSEVNHKDEDKSNNCIDNIEWCNRKYNNTYGTFRKRMAEKLSSPILQLTLDGVLIKEWESSREIERVNGYDHTTINRCCNGGFYSKSRGKWVNCIQYRGYKWQYA